VYGKETLNGYTKQLKKTEAKKKNENYRYPGDDIGNTKQVTKLTRH